ncbi:MAG: hypothetical protein H6621_07935 [Halobacteriovoraceae bacterium]|nr:hypothetical protein [Halobacteriovoraceae bacterium]
MVERKRDNSEILQVESLKNYFFDLLDQFNSESPCPLPQEIVFYSSDVLEEYSLSDRFSEDRALGMALLESVQLSPEEQKREFKKVGDVALLMSSYYSESINKKILDRSYYINIGKSAYYKLNGVRPRCFDMPAFFERLAESFELIGALFTRLSLEVKSDPNQKYLLNLLKKEDDLSDIERIALNVAPNSKKIVS